LSRNYIRAIKLEVGSSGGSTLDMSQLRIKFYVRQSSVQSLNSAEFRVYNMKKDTAQLVAGKNSEFKAIKLDAGYQDNCANIYKGSIIHTRTGRENPVNTYADFYCRDGDQGYNWGIVNKTFAAGSTQRDHVDEILKVLKPFGITEGTIKGLSDQKYPRPVVLYGMARDTMRIISRSNEAAWYILNNKLFHIPYQDPGEGDAFKLNANTGLIGMPQETQTGIVVTALINPQFAVGKQLIIDEKSIQRAPWGLNYGDTINNLKLDQLGTSDGVYKIFSIEWRGDTHETEWYATMVCHGAISGTPPASSTKLVTTGT